MMGGTVPRSMSNLQSTSDTIRKSPAVLPAAARRGGARKSFGFRAVKAPMDDGATTE